MKILLSNLSWMGLNIILALIPPLFGWLILKTRQKLLQLAFALLWFFFLPNTLYPLTDLSHLLKQWHHLHSPGQIVLALQYLALEIIGLTSFVSALYPVEKRLLLSHWRKKKWWLTFCLIAVNFFIGFGMVLGRIQRVNSWDIFLNGSKVVQASLHVSTSRELMILALLFGIFANSFYFFFRKRWKMSFTSVPNRDHEPLM